MLVLMRFSVIASGSNANCTFLESNSSRILIDCGLSARETHRRLVELGINPTTLNGIIITHEHSDHIIGLSRLSRTLKIPVYTTKKTAKCLAKVYALELITLGQEFSIGSLRINTFRVSHDAVDPVGYIIEDAGLKFAQATDLGEITDNVLEALRFANAIVLESNHDPEMLQTCNYPWDLKKRIASKHGHLSNFEAAKILNSIDHADLAHVVLAHLSENSNTPTLAYETVNMSIKRRPQNLICASRKRSLPFIELSESKQLCFSTL